MVWSRLYICKSPRVDPALDLPLPDFEDRSSFFDFRARFGLRDQSYSAFRDHFGFDVSELPGYVRCPPADVHTMSYGRNTFAQVRHPKRPRRWALPDSLPRLPLECEYYHLQPDKDIFEQLHWHAHYVIAALKDLALLWPSKNSTAPALLDLAEVEDYILDGSTFDPRFEAEIDTDDSAAWSSAHESDKETAAYSINDSMGYETRGPDLVAIKQEPPSAAETTPFVTPTPSKRLDDATLRRNKVAVPFHQDAARIFAGTSLLSMRSSEGMTSPPHGMRTFTRMYCIRRDIFSPAPPQPRRFTAEEKGKAKAIEPVSAVEETAIDDSAPVVEPPTVEADPAVENAAIRDIVDDTVQAQEEDDPTKYTAAKFFAGSTTRGGILRYDGRSQGKKGVNELQDSYMVLRTSGQGLRASEINGVYHGLNNVNTLSVCLACSMIPGGYACHFEAGKKQGCTRCIKRHLTCSNELTVERLEIMFQQIGPLISGAMPALADTFALLQAFLSKAAREQTEAATSVKMALQLIKR
ncbi:hypothetical protein MPER_09894, partial [Moniliophthora perniciosa FA553]